jgi:hypothetical protein
MKTHNHANAAAKASIPAFGESRYKLYADTTGAKAKIRKRCSINRRNTWLSMKCRIVEAPEVVANLSVLYKGSRRSRLDTKNSIEDKKRPE